MDDGDAETRASREALRAEAPPAPRRGEDAGHAERRRASSSTRPESGVWRLEPSELENCDLDELFDAVAAWQEGAPPSEGRAPTPNGDSGAVTASPMQRGEPTSNGPPPHDRPPIEHAGGARPPTLHARHSRGPAAEERGAAVRVTPREQAPSDHTGASGDGGRAGGTPEDAKRLRQRLSSLEGDFDRYKRRVERQRRDDERRATERLLRAMLPILDDLDRAQQASAGGLDAMQHGLRLIAQRLRQTLGGFGLRSFEAVGAQFDPERHDAIRTTPAQNAEPNEVVAEFERGYLLFDTLLRPARVCVAVADPASLQADAATEPGTTDPGTAGTGDAHVGPPPIPPEARAREPREP